MIKITIKTSFIIIMHEFFEKHASKKNVSNHEILILLSRSKKTFIEKQNIENIFMISNYFEKCANSMFLH